MTHQCIVTRMCVCLSVCLHSYETISPNFTEISVFVTYGSVILWCMPLRYAFCTWQYPFSHTSSVHCVSAWIVSWLLKPIPMINLAYMLMCSELCWEASSHWRRRDGTGRKRDLEADGRAMVVREKIKQDV